MISVVGYYTICTPTLNVKFSVVHIRNLVQGCLGQYLNLGSRVTDCRPTLSSKLQKNELCLNLHFNSVLDSLLSEGQKISENKRII